ncbi:MAG: hypothetical protein ABI891_05445 [Acidobacteriota bacterium]
MEHDNTIMNSVICAIAVFIAVFVGLFFLFFVLGLLTGIFGICATASQEWENVYWKLRIFIPAIAVVAGIIIGKYNNENSKFK